MAIDLLFLLLPIAALSGWWLGRHGRPQKRERDCNEIPSDYIKGLNFLLNEQQDKALDIFIRMLEVDRDTVETHLALGSLFRRRGEVDRAIRVHQNLIARPTLSREHRAQALFELGHDYMRAGVFDRAESIFQELINSEPHTEHALWQLIGIYQQEKDWDKAIEIAHRLEAVSGKHHTTLIAQYYCEMAEGARRKSEWTTAMKLIRCALSTDRNCARASIIEGDMQLLANEPKLAIRAYRRVEQQDPDFVSETVQPLIDCYGRLGRSDEMIAYLQRILAHHGGTTIMLALAELERQRRGEEAAVVFITRYLTTHPSVRGMHHLIELKLDSSRSEERENLKLLEGLTEALLENKAIYKCHTCGFSGKSLHWQCPSCKHWNTTKPISGPEGE